MAPAQHDIVKATTWSADAALDAVDLVLVVRVVLGGFVVVDNSFIASTAVWECIVDVEERWLVEIVDEAA